MEADLAKALGEAYPAFINELGLTDELTGEPLILDSYYTGSYADYVLRCLSSSATTYLKPLSADDRAAYLAGKEAWLSWDDDNQTASVTDIVAFGQYVGRMPGVPQFDAMGDGSTANWTFGDTDEASAHFTTYIAELLRDLGYREEADSYGEVSPLVAEQVRLLNPYTFLGVGDSARYIRIRIGTKDFFVPGVVSMNIATAIMNRTDSEVDYAMLWDVGHDGDIGTDTWFDYIEGIVR